MAKIKNIAVITVTFIICAATVLWAVPHHVVTKKQAEDLACECVLYRMDNPELKIESAETVSIYSDKGRDTNKDNVLKQIINYFNPKLIYYLVEIKTNMYDFKIKVGTYSRYVWSDEEGVWGYGEVFPSAIIEYNGKEIPCYELW